MTTKMETRDFIRVLSEAYSNGYPNLLARLNIDLVGSYVPKGNKTVSSTINSLHEKNMSDLNHIWTPASRTFSHNFEVSVAKYVSIMREAGNMAPYGRFVIERDVWSILRPMPPSDKNIAIKYTSSISKDPNKAEDPNKALEFLGMVLASAYCSQKVEEIDSNSVDHDVEEAIDAFLVACLLGADCVSNLGISYFVAEISLVGQRTDLGLNKSFEREAAAVFFTEEEGIQFLAQRLLVYEPRLAYKGWELLARRGNQGVEHRASADEFVMSRIDSPSLEGKLRTPHEIIGHFNENNRMHGYIYQAEIISFDL